jgi:biotin operon repressor
MKRANNITCCDCISELSKNEIALSKKLLGRNVEKYMCINCLADYLCCTEEDLETKVQEFKEQGCSLFL